MRRGSSWRYVYLAFHVRIVDSEACRRLGVPLVVSVTSSLTSYLFIIETVGLIITRRCCGLGPGRRAGGDWQRRIANTEMRYVVSFKIESR